MNENDTIYLDQDNNIVMEFNSNAEMVPGRIKKIPKQDWQFVDKKGHVHRADGLNLPTLAGYLGRHHKSIYYRCKICKEIVEPEFTFETEEPFFVPGTIEWSGSFDYDATLVSRSKELRPIPVVAIINGTKISGKIVIIHWESKPKINKFTFYFRGIGLFKDEPLQIKEVVHE